MPRFYFHLRKSGKRVTDVDGMILPDAAAARAEAIAAARDFHQRTVGELDPDWRNCALEVCDEGGRCVFLIGFAAAARLADAAPADAPEKTAKRTLASLALGHTRNEFLYLAGQTRFLLERIGMLADRGRYETKNLSSLRKSMEENRRYAIEVLARSRQQSAELRGGESGATSRTSFVREDRL